MRNILIEGTDNTGKSTLIRHLTVYIPRLVVYSEGPEMYPGEINHRIDKYLNYQSVFFDRHPAISEAIYCSLRNAPGPDPERVQAFYNTHPIIVYCRPPDGRDPMEGHEINPLVDTEEHLSQVLDNYDTLLERYDEWALRRAHFVYRIGDDQDQLINALRGILDETS